jgi:DNA recombination protein RmuC
MTIFVEHLKDTGKAIDSVVKNYNNTIGSFEARLMPSIKKLQELGVSPKEIEKVQSVDSTIHLPENIEGT